MGWGVNDKETFSYFLQELTKQSVYNLAVSSYGTEREIARFEKSCLLENTDIIIIQYHENQFLKLLLRIQQKPADLTQVYF